MANGPTPILDGAQHTSDQAGISTAEPVDGLLGIANPYRTLGELRQFNKECQLKRTRVLKLIDHDEVEFGSECLPHGRTCAQSSQQQHLLVAEVHRPKSFLRLRVRVQNVGRQVEDEVQVSPHIGMKGWVRFMGLSGGLYWFQEVLHLGASVKPRSSDPVRPTPTVSAEQSIELLQILESL